MFKKGNNMQEVLICFAIALGIMIFFSFPEFCIVLCLLAGLVYLVICFWKVLLIVFGVIIVAFILASIFKAVMEECGKSHTAKNRIDSKNKKILLIAYDKIKQKGLYYSAIRNIEQSVYGNIDPLKIKIRELKQEIQKKYDKKLSKDMFMLSCSILIVFIGGFVFIIALCYWFFVYLVDVFGYLYLPVLLPVFLTCACWIIFKIIKIVFKYFEKMQEQLERKCKEKYQEEIDNLIFKIYNVPNNNESVQCYKTDIIPQSIEKQKGKHYKKKRNIMIQALKEEAFVVICAIVCIVCIIVYFLSLSTTSI